VSTAVINEVLEEAVPTFSPNQLAKDVRENLLWYQVSSQPPTIALFVNDAKRFNDNYRRYIERQFRQQLGFTGTPIRLFWRSKKTREVEISSGANEPPVFNLHGFTAIATTRLYLEQPTWLHRLDPRVKLAWLMSFLWHQFGQIPFGAFWWY